MEGFRLSPVRGGEREDSSYLRIISFTSGSFVVFNIVRAALSPSVLTLLDLLLTSLVVYAFTRHTRRCTTVSDSLMVAHQS